MLWLRTTCGELCVSSHPLLFLLLSMFQCVWGLAPRGIYLQHGSQEGRTIQPVSTLWPRCHSPLMCADGGAQTQQDWVDACWSQTVGPPGSRRAASDLLWSEGGDWLNCPLFLTIHTPPRPSTRFSLCEYKLNTVTLHMLSKGAASNIDLGPW